MATFMSNFLQRPLKPSVGKSALDFLSRQDVVSQVAPTPAKDSKKLRCCKRLEKLI